MVKALWSLFEALSSELEPTLLVPSEYRHYATGFMVSSQLMTVFHSAAKYLERWRAFLGSSHLPGHLPTAWKTLRCSCQRSLMPGLIDTTPIHMLLHGRIPPTYKAH